jgi:hypothetical protein
LHHFYSAWHLSFYSNLHRRKQTSIITTCQYFLGEGSSSDTYDDSTAMPFMGQTGSYSGQYWKLIPEEGGYYRHYQCFSRI